MAFLALSADPVIGINLFQSAYFAVSLLGVGVGVQAP